MVILFFLVISAQSILCSDVFVWQMACEEPNLNDHEWKFEHCLSNNTWYQNCTVYPVVECEGSRNFTRLQWCPNTTGFNYGRTVLFSYLFGVFGVDRFYLGYTSIGFMKLFTGGFFIVGYLVDCILITCQIVKPANGMGYAALKPFPLLMGHPHRDIF